MRIWPNALIQQRLREARPDYGWLSEETEDDTARLTCRRVWVVDPIDGTRAFLQGVAHFCHAVALVEDGRPIAAALFNPAVDEFYEAVTGEGAKLNGRPIKVSDRQEIAGCRMAAFGPMFRNPRWPEPWPEMEIIQRDRWLIASRWSPMAKQTPLSASTPKTTGILRLPI